MGFDPQDYYYKKAKKEKYSARSVYKLEEIFKKFPPLKKIEKNAQVLDLGCYPGSWSEYLTRNICGKGKVVGVDLQKLQSSLLQANFDFIHGDFTTDEIKEKIKSYGNFDLVVSDMAPKTTGIKMVDQARSLDLVVTAFDFIKNYLRQNGHFIIKIFESNEISQIVKKEKKLFGESKVFRPQATRKESKECFFVGCFYRPPTS